MELIKRVVFFNTVPVHTEAEIDFQDGKSHFRTQLGRDGIINHLKLTKCILYYNVYAFRIKHAVNKITTQIISTLFIYGEKKFKFVLTN